MPSKPLKDWTVMIYMAGDNNLDDTSDRKSEAIKDFKLIKKIGSTDRVSILAQLDRAGRKKTIRLHLTKGGDFNDDIVESFGETNSGDPCELVDFLDWGMKRHPARRYMVILWGHGAGALDVDYLTGDDPPPSRLKSCRRRLRQSLPRLVKERGMKSISEDDLFPHHQLLFERLIFAPSKFSLLARDRAKLIGVDQPTDGPLDYLDNRELKFAFEEIKKRHRRRIDVVGMDACLMSMVEIGFQLRGLVDYLVGSQDLVPKEGFPYDKIFQQMTDNPAITPRELSAEMVRHYINSFAAKFNPTLSACDLRTLNVALEKSLAGAIGHLAKMLLGFISHLGADTEAAKMVRSAILHARGRSQYYDVGDYVDIYHFSDLLERYWDRASVEKERLKNGSRVAISLREIRQIQSACRKVKSHFGPDKFVIASKSKGRPVRNSNGLSIYFPIKGMDPTYKVIDFVEKTVWQDFIDTFVKQIQWLDFLQEFSHNTRTPFRLRIPTPLD